MAEADVIRAVLAERVRLASFESARATALAADFDARTGGLLDTLRTLEEAARRGPLSPAQRTAAADARAGLTRVMREIRASYRAGLQGDLFTVARREAGLTSATIRAEVGAAGSVPAADLQAVLARPVRGSTWFQRLDANLLGMADRVDGALLVATRRGSSMTDAARLLGDALGAVDGSRGRLVRIARTELQRVANDAATLTYRANSDVVRAVRYLATLDSRVCPVCEPLHNEVFEMDEEGRHSGPPLPQHPNCRCFYAPVTRSLSELAGVA